MPNFFLLAAFSLSSIHVLLNAFYYEQQSRSLPTSMAILLLSIAGVLFNNEFVISTRKIIARVLCASAAVIGFAELAHGVSLPSFLVIVLIALSILFFRSEDSAKKRSPTIFIAPVLLITLFSLISRMYGVRLDSPSGPYIAMCWISSIGFTLLGAHLILRPPYGWPFNVLAASYPTLAMSRYFLLLFSLVPVVCGGLFLYVEQMGFLDIKTAAASCVFVCVVLFWLIIVRGACWAHRLGVARDLAVRRLEESWKSRESYFRKLVDESPVILYLTGEDGACSFLSKKWETYTGRPTVRDLGFGWLECVHPEDRVRMEKLAKRVGIPTAESFTTEYRLRRWDGQYRWVSASLFPRFDDQHRFMGFMGNLIDVHERKAQEELLKKDKQTAEISSQTKSQFLANMSHEIRTPLNAILGFADLCSDTQCNEDERVDYLKRIRCNGDHLLRLIDDILDLAKVESGNALVQKSQFSIERVMDEIIGSLKALASQKGLRLALHRSSDLPSTVFSDPHRIKQIVNNLVGNSIKFTTLGEVRVEVKMNSGKLEVEIADTGVGLSSQQVQNLFKPFSQADGSVTRKFGGTGLGLHLSRKLAQSLGGDVTLKASEPGHGSVFSFTFAIGTEEERRPKQNIRRAPSRPLLVMPKTRPLKKLYGKKILVVEDSPDGRELIHLYFRSTGAQLIYAENGFEAIGAAWREKPELILMDVQMPGMDGLEATRRLRNEGFKRPIVALTAHALQDEVDRSFEAGCNYHLTKPVMRDVLLSLVGELLQHSPTSHLKH